MPTEVGRQVIQCIDCYIPIAIEWIAIENVVEMFYVRIGKALVITHIHTYKIFTSF